MIPMIDPFQETLSLKLLNLLKTSSIVFPNHQRNFAIHEALSRKPLDIKQEIETFRWDFP